MADWSVGEEITAAKLNERRGFSSRMKARHTLPSQYARHDTETVVILDVEVFDTDNEFSNSQKTGTTTAAAANKLIDTTLNQFTESDVGKWVYNSTDKLYQKVIGFVSSSELTLAGNIFPTSPKAYRVFESKFVASKAGYYFVSGTVRLSLGTDQKAVGLRLFLNDTVIFDWQSTLYNSKALPQTVSKSGLLHLDVDDKLELFIYHDEAADKIIDNIAVTLDIIRVAED